jgi:phosphopantothenoylcysteine decarboxylase / phosphopantothenate---cysteine ligase
MNVLIGITGGIAAYKVCEVVSTLAKSGVCVRVLMSEQSQQFVSPVTLAALSRQPVYTDEDFWSPQQGRPLHIALGEWADVYLLSPLTANTLAKLSHGLADNLLTNTVLASRCPVLLAPAMNTDMWLQPVVARNWQQLLSDERYHAVGPGAGLLACDRVGAGRMAEPAQIVSHVTSLLQSQGRRDLQGKHLLISAGSTQEYLDPVRFIGNPSTGRMGVALALAALHRGARVTLVHGPLTDEVLACLPPMPEEAASEPAVQPSLTCVALTSAAEMEQAMLRHLPQADWVIMAAAVADVRPAEKADHKLPKDALPAQLPLVAVPDIVAQLAARKAPGQRIVGFAAQTGDIVSPAIAKLKRKQLDAIVANPVDKPGSGFGSWDNEAVVLSATGQKLVIPHGSKLQLSHRIYDFLLTV